MTRRVLAIGAHPDDIEFTCAGTLARLKALGWEIQMAVLTAGDLGAADGTCEQIAEIRREEQRKSAALLGAALQMLEFRDLEIEFTVEARARVTEAVRAADPHIVFAPPPMDYMADHEVTSQLARAACFEAGVTLHVTGERAPIERIPHLYYADPIEGTDIFGDPASVSVFVDITETLQTKLDMLACHASQREWLMKRHGMDQYIDAARQWTARRGTDASIHAGRDIPHAEAFRQHRGHPYPHDDLLAELLGGSG